jgi:hypothetical protein
MTLSTLHIIAGDDGDRDEYRNIASKMSDLYGLSFTDLLLPEDDTVHVVKVCLRMISRVKSEPLHNCHPFLVTSPV